MKRSPRQARSVRPRPPTTRGRREQVLIGRLDRGHDFACDAGDAKPHVYFADHIMPEWTTAPTLRYGGAGPGIFRVGGR